MNIAHELLALLQRFADRSPLPRVRALHLPPAAAMNTKDGEFCALELDDGSIGLSYLLLDAASRALPGEGASDAAALAGTAAMDIARWYAEDSGARRTLGFAAVNALSRCLFDRAGYVPEDSTDSIGMLDPGPEDHVGMVGFFPPLARRITATGARLTVVELKPELAGDYPGYRVTLAPADLAACNKVLSTSTVLLNGSIDGVLVHCRKASRIALIGPGAGCLPDPAFARGATFFGGTWIADGPAFCAALAAGERWSDSARKVAVSRAAYPGFDALLGRL
jgi:uncharacterized protein (DUF4213/DUF364 family)